MEYSVSRRDLMTLLGGAALAGTSIEGTRAAPGASSTLRVSARANPSSLDPITGLAGDDTPFLWPVHSTLLDFDYDSLALKPGLALSWSYPDSHSFTLKLRPGLVFHDGTPLDAEAVRFNFERARTDPRSTIRTDLASIDTIETSGADTVILHLKQPDAVLPLALTSRAGMMVSPTAAKALGDKLVRAPVGAGPWRFASWTDNASVKLTRFDKYWQPAAAKVDQLEFTIIPELNTGLRAVVAGETDVVYRLSPQLKPVADRARNARPIIGPTLYFHLIYFNPSRPPFSDVRVRQAVCYGIDRNEFNQGSMLSLGEIANSAVPKAHWAYDPSLADFFKYDPDKSRALLKAAGHPNGIDIPTIGWNDQYSQQRQEILIEQLSKVGIRMKVSRYAIADASTIYLGPEKRGEAMISAWTGRPDPSMTYNLLTSATGFFNPSQIQDYPGLAEALVEAQTTLDPDKRKQALFKVQRLTAEGAWFCPIVFEPEVDCAAKSVQGFRPNLIGWPRFDDVSVGAA